MNRTRVRQYVERLTRWREIQPDIRNRPFIMIEREMMIEEAKRRFGFVSSPGAIAVGIGYTVYEPLTVEVDPWPKR